MLDSSNANFLLWPPCVEVQRCSGCCNTKSLHCVPVVTHIRYLQVTNPRTEELTRLPGFFFVFFYDSCLLLNTPPLPPQVMKIEYANKRPTYAKAVVSVVDHVECRCQDVPRLPTPRKKSSRRQHGHHLRNQTLSQGHEQVDTGRAGSCFSLSAECAMVKFRVEFHRRRAKFTARTNSTTGMS